MANKRSQPDLMYIFSACTAALLLGTLTGLLTAPRGGSKTRQLIVKRIQRNRKAQNISETTPTENTTVNMQWLESESEAIIDHIRRNGEP